MSRDMQQKVGAYAKMLGKLAMVTAVGGAGLSLMGCGADDLIRDIFVARLVSSEAGADGTNGLDGAPGADGIDGANGADGVDGLPGADGTDGADGSDGLDGEDGLDGNTDGFLEFLEDCYVMCPPSFRDPCEIVCPESDESATRLTIDDAKPKED